jgi:hypothetical protein
MHIFGGRVLTENAVEMIYHTTKFDVILGGCRIERLRIWVIEDRWSPHRSSARHSDRLILADPPVLSRD